MSRLRRIVRDLIRSARVLRSPLGSIVDVVRDSRPAAATLRDGSRFEAPEMTSFLSAAIEVYHDGRYTPDELPIETGDVVVDVGAHVGIFTIFAARRASRVIAVEPSPSNLSYLRRNLALNDVSNVTVVEAAIAGEDGRGRLAIGSHSVGNMLGTIEGDRPAGETIEVETMTLGTLMASSGIDRIAFLKLDCEGAEGEILRSLTSGEFARIERIAIEFHDGWSTLDHREIAALLERHGYTTWSRWDGRSPFGYVYGKRVAGSR